MSSPFFHFVLIPTFPQIAGLAGVGGLPFRLGKAAVCRCPVGFSFLSRDVMSLSLSFGLALWNFGTIRGLG